MLFISVSVLFFGNWFLVLYVFSNSELSRGSIGNCLFTLWGGKAILPGLYSWDFSGYISIIFSKQGFNEEPQREANNVYIFQTCLIENQTTGIEGLSEMIFLPLKGRFVYILISSGSTREFTLCILFEHDLRVILQCK